MPGCSDSSSGNSSSLSGANASMTVSQGLGSIQAFHEASLMLLDDSIFAEGKGRFLPPRRGQPGPNMATPRRLSKLDRRMSAPVLVAHSNPRPVQLTPLWEYVVRTRRFPSDVDASNILDEISERLRDPEWEVRQHALRVLVDVLPTLGPGCIDELASLVLNELIDNLGNPAPAVRKGSLDALRIYLLHSPNRDQVTRDILHAGINRADALDEYETSVASGVILAAPLLLFPSRSSPRPGRELIRDAVQQLALRLVQVSHQEASLRSLAKIREHIGAPELYAYLAQLDDTMVRNFRLLCDVYGVSEGRSESVVPNHQHHHSHHRRGRTMSRGSPSKLIRHDSVEDSIKDVVAVDASWESEDDSDTSGIVEEDDDARTNSGSVSSARILLETEIKFDEETAITMTILEEQHEPNKDAANLRSEQQDVELAIEATLEELTPDDRNRKPPRRVHFGGEVVKLRTPDSEDAESVVSVTIQHQQHQQHLQPPRQPQGQQGQQRTRIPLPVMPATSMPRRPRSSSQPVIGSTRWARHTRQRRSASSSPRRRPHFHQADLSPKKSILSKGHGSPLLSPRAISPQTRLRTHISRRDSISPLTSPRLLIEEIRDDLEPERAFRVCTEFEIVDDNDERESIHSPLGETCKSRGGSGIDGIFGDKSGTKQLQIQSPLKNRKNLENTRRSTQSRCSSAVERSSHNLEWDGLREAHGKEERRRSSSARPTPGFETFPRQERNYILMELSSPVKDLSRRSSVDSNAPNDQKIEPSQTLETPEQANNDTKDVSEEPNVEDEKKEDEVKPKTPEVVPEDSNRLAEVEAALQRHMDEELEREQEEELLEEKSILDAKERSSDSSTDSDWRQLEPSWEQLGIVDPEVLDDFHNTEDWRARVRGLERMTSALRTSSALEGLEPRLGSLLHALLGGERNCRVAAAALEAARVVLSGVSEEALKNNLPLIAWGLARQGGPNAAHLSRIVMLRTSPGLFVEKLLQPQCIGARNAKMRENTLQLLIFSLITFPSTEFTVHSAIDGVIAMVGDRRKRVRLAALDALAVISQIYASEDILEASKRYTSGKQDGPSIYAAIKTRLSRKVLPTVSVDGLVVYGLQISSNSQHKGADVEWIVAGSGSVSPGTGRMRNQLISTSRMDDSISEEILPPKKSMNRPASEHSATRTTGLSIDKNERIASWKLLPQSDKDDGLRRKFDRTSKSADYTQAYSQNSKSRSKDSLGDQDKTYKPYATPKRSEKKQELQVSKSEETDTSRGSSGQIRPSSSAPILNQESSKQESRIPIYTGRNPGAKPVDMSGEGRETSLSRGNRRYSQGDRGDGSSYLNTYPKRRHSAVKNEVPRLNHSTNYDHVKSQRHTKFDKFFDDMDADLQAKFEEEYNKLPPDESFKKYSQRAMSYEKLNKGLETVMKNPRAVLKNVPNHQYSTKFNETRYETIYQRQQRLREERIMKPRDSTPNSPFYGYDYENYINRRIQEYKSDRSTKVVQTDDRSPYKKRGFSSLFGERIPIVSSGSIDRSSELETDSSSQGDRSHAPNAVITRSANPSLRSLTPHPDGGVTEQSAIPAVEDISRSSSNGSSRASDRLGSAILRAGRNTESEESPGLSSPQPASPYPSRSFDVISASGSPVPDAAAQADANGITKPVLEETSTESEAELRRRRFARRAPSVDSSSPHSPSLVEDRVVSNGRLDRSADSPRNDRNSALDDSALELNEVGASGDSHNLEETSDSPGTDGPAFETLRFQEAEREQAILSPTIASSTPLRSRSAQREYVDDLATNRAGSNATIHSYDSVDASPKNRSPDRSRFIPAHQDITNDSDETPPLPIGFGVPNLPASSDASDDPYEDVDEPQTPQHQKYQARLQSAHHHESPVSSHPTPQIHQHPRRLYKVSPCKLRPQPNCLRSTSVPANRHFSDSKHPDKTSKAVQMCFNQLESKDWESNLKGLRTLSQVARDEPEQLDFCAPGVVARLLGKHVRNLRSQVARVACTATAEVFRAHVRGIEQDLDEVAGPLLHRTADTNRFLREDCNVALDSMIEHFPPQKTIMTIANRGASHQNMIVHATTARLLYAIVSEMGPEHVMYLQREVRDKLLVTTAKLLTDGNLLARKQAKETFRLLSRCEGFRKALTDSVPDTTLRLIEKTLRSL